MNLGEQVVYYYKNKEELPKDFNARWKMQTPKEEIASLSEILKTYCNNEDIIEAKKIKERIAFLQSKKE